MCNVEPKLNQQAYIKRLLKPTKVQEALLAFRLLARDIDEKANEHDDEVGLAFVACASSIRRVCDEIEKIQ